MMKVWSHPSSRAAVNTTVSNTGWASAGDRLKTRRISDVAACRASAAFSSPASFVPSDLGLAEADRFAALAVRFGGVARRLAGAFLAPFLGELPFAEPRPMAGPYTAMGVEYRLCRIACRGRTTKSGTDAGPAPALTFAAPKILIRQPF